MPSGHFLPGAGEAAAALPIGQEESGAAQLRRGQSVHLPEKAQALRRQEEVLPVEVPAERELPVLPPGAGAPADGLRRGGEQGFPDGGSPGEAGGEGDGVAAAKIPGIPPAEDAEGAAAELTALGIETPDAAFVAGDFVAEGGGVEGEGGAGRQGGPVGLLRQGEEEALAVAEIAVCLVLIEALDAPEGPAGLPHRLGEGAGEAQHRHAVHRPLPLQGEGLRLQTLE